MTVSDISPAPSDRAWRFVDRLRALTPHEWDEVVQRGRAVDVIAERLATRRLLTAVRCAPDALALDRLNRAACAAAETMQRLQGACDYAGRLAAHAALAVALAHELLDGELMALYGPFAAHVPLTDL
jgi:hypothetical protein